MGRSFPTNITREVTHALWQFYDDFCFSSGRELYMRQKGWWKAGGALNFVLVLTSGVKTKQRVSTLASGRVWPRAARHRILALFPTPTHGRSAPEVQRRWKQISGQYPKGGSEVGTGEWQGLLVNTGSQLADTVSPTGSWSSFLAHFCITEGCYIFLRT